MHMTPAQAAERAGVSRWTIMRAIKAHDLKASRNNRNRWIIAETALDAWRSHSLHSVRAQEDAPELAQQSTRSEEHVRDREELAGLRVEGRMLREAVEAAERDREVWRGEAEAWKRQAQDLTGELARRRRWWPWR